MVTVDKHTSASVTKVMRLMLGAELYEAIGLLETNPSLALFRVKGCIRGADVNAMVRPWRSRSVGRATLLTHLIGHKFRPDHSSKKEITEGHLRYLGDVKVNLWKAVDKNRHEIIKLFISNGATIDQNIVDLALNMLDYYTVQLLDDALDARGLDLDMDGQRIDIRSTIFDRGYAYQFDPKDGDPCNPYMEMQDSGIHMPFESTLTVYLPAVVPAHDMPPGPWRSMGGFGPWSDTEDGSDSETESEDDFEADFWNH